MTQTIHGEAIVAGLTAQADYCDTMTAPVTARIVRSAIALMDGRDATGRRIAAWPGDALEDALGLRFAAALRALHLAGATDRLRAVYDGSMRDQASVDAQVAGCVAEHDTAILPWLDHPPQTNEAGRSATIIAGLRWLGLAVPNRFALTEIGSSAGLNMMIAHYRYLLGGLASGPPGAAIVIEPRWDGPPPAGPAPVIIGVDGSDIAPLDLADPRAAMRLRAFVWPEAPERLVRLDAGIALARRLGITPARRDAVDAVKAMLAAPIVDGVTRVLFHTIVWQYLTDADQARIIAAMEDAGRTATPEAPLAWLALETDRATIRHRLVARLWSGRARASGQGGPLDGQPVTLGEAHAHGAWVRWLGAPHPASSRARAA